MRRTLMLLAGLSLAGCGAFSTHSDVVEEAAGQQFTAQRLADILTSVKGPIAYDTRMGQLVTTIWTDLTLFSQAVANNRLTSDSSLVADAMWPMITNATAARWLDTVLAHRAKVSDALIDSSYKADQVRAVQHMLIKVDSNASKADKDAARKKAEDYLAQIKSGSATLSQLAYAHTDDEGSKNDSGWYGLKPRQNAWVEPFAKSLWSLKPGEVSGLVPTVFGWHIIRRPTDEESRKIWRDSLTRAVADPIIKGYQDELLTTYNVKVEPSAPAHMRAAIDDLDGHATDKTSLATYKDGSFTVGDFVKWIRAATSDPTKGPQALEQFKASPDSAFTSVAKAMTQQSLLVHEAQKNHVTLAPAEWKEMETGFANAIDTIKASLGLNTLDPKASTSERSKIAAQKVDQFFTDLVNQKAQLRPMPGVLSATLRQHEKTKFSPVALQRALDIAKTKRAADSTKASHDNGQPPAPAPGAIKPAPGGAPVPGGDAPAVPAPRKP